MDNLSLDETKALASCYSTMRGTSNLSVFALSGDEGDRTTYTSKLTFSELAENFNIVPQDELPAGVMLQRELAKSRSRAIANYILSSEDFIFPEVIAIVEMLSVSEFKQMGNVVKMAICILRLEIEVSFKLRYFRFVQILVETGLIAKVA